MTPCFTSYPIADTQIQQLSVLPARYALYLHKYRTSSRYSDYRTYFRSHTILLFCGWKSGTTQPTSISLPCTGLMGTCGFGGQSLDTTQVGYIFRTLALVSVRGSTADLNRRKSTMILWAICCHRPRQPPARIDRSSKAIFKTCFCLWSIALLTPLYHILRGIVRNCPARI